ncbi:MAG: DUF192 domain-containing protein [Cyanobium sp. PLM2.Bin73]|nr:MAG: DUF192 domain-containing protein [Cyanobium sp. PLM2.Bin73]
MRAPTLPGLALRSLALLGLALAGLLVPPAALRARGDQGSPQQAPPQVLPVTARWCLEPRHCIDLEVADTPRRQALGLQLRPPLPPLRGMWFPYEPPAVARFWMHRTPAALDMLFVRDGRVLAIEADVQPCMRLPCPSYGPDQPVEGVLEIGAGEAERLGITAGTPVRIEPLGSEPLRDGGPPAPAPD